MDSQAAPGPYAIRLNDVVSGYHAFKKNILPLCAAETPISDYVRSFAASALQEKYAMGGPLAPPEGNFIGAEHVLDLHQLVVDLCHRLYGARYADPRPTTGVGAVTNLLMTLSEPGQKVVLQHPDSGGHPSMGHICRRLGLETTELPYDYRQLDMDTDGVGEALISSGADFLFLAPSDILYPPRFDELKVPEHVTIIYDATQTLGLIASDALPNPIATHGRFILLGGTHKTLPGPSSGLIMTCNSQIAHRIDTELSPKFLRHSQPHQIASLAACLIEQLAIGRRYAARIQAFSIHLSKLLFDKGLAVIERDGEPTRTHQIFLAVSTDALDGIYNRFAGAGITLNKKEKKLFRGAGLRLGVQEIARYHWEIEHLDRLASLIVAVIDNVGGEEQWRREVVELARLNCIRPDLTAANGTALDANSKEDQPRF